MLAVSASPAVSSRRLAVSRRALITWTCLVVVGMGPPIAAADDKPPAPDLSKFPKLEGKVTQALGQFNSFGPPKAGEPFRLNLADIVKARQLQFDPERKSSIPFPGPAAVEAVRYYSNGAFQDLRLVARGDWGRVAIDIVPKPGQGPNRVLVWVVVESGVVEGVALIECEASGPFPGRPK
jgi:hypothetical protein